jgi:hypothetical protein
MKKENILWAVNGAGRLVRISSKSVFHGTLLAAKRAKISIGAFTAVDGALIGKRIRMGRETTVTHKPFTALLHGDVVDTPNLSVRSVNLRYSVSPNRDTGSVRLKAIIDDTSSKHFREALANNGVQLRFADAANFNQVAVSLSGCTQRGPRIFVCRSGDTRATVRVLRDDPNIYTLTLIRRRLTTAQTGSTQPTAPVTVTMTQDDGVHPLVTRLGHINTCRPRGTVTLTCHMP